jgi:hypothetical protein
LSIPPTCTLPVKACYTRNISERGTTMRAILVGTMLALAVTTAGAQDDDINSANFMVPHCRALVARESSNFLFQGVCVGTIDSLQYVRPLMGCADIPNGVTADEAINVIIRYIEARPGRMHELFKALAIEAMFNAWPCKP